MNLFQVNMVRGEAEKPVAIFADRNEADALIEELKDKEQELIDQIRDPEDGSINNEFYTPAKFEVSLWFVGERKI